MGAFLYNIIIYPIEFLVELVYVFFYKALSNEGIAIAGVSLAVNIIALPLYNIAEKLQKKERELRLSLAPGIARIKEAFTGDERYMLLSTFYRQNNYHPLYALRSSASLLIQIPFFIAAYNFLSHLQDLNGVSFLFIHNLGAPDGLLTIGGIAINALPLLMTLINIVVGIIYTKGFPRRDKFQLYGMAVLFLVLLYNSPAGLVYYWILNNLFSLGKNLFYKLRHPAWTFYGVAAIASIAGTLFIISNNTSITFAKSMVIIVASIVICLIPLWVWVSKKIFATYLSTLLDSPKIYTKLFILSCILLWVLHGLLVPSNLIASSTQEFATIGATQNPLVYVWHTATIFFGIFLLWPMSIFLLSPKKIRIGATLALFVLSVSALMNAFIFQSDYGVINPLLIFENVMLLKPSRIVALGSLLGTLLVAGVGILFVAKKRTSLLVAASTIAIFAGIIASSWSMVNIQKDYNVFASLIAQDDYGQKQVTELEPVLTLSRDGKNIIILMLDRAINSYFPMIVSEFPELEKQFEGFVYYPNTVSFGSGTLTGAPALMGGYEYTPRKINQRAEERLVDKHNEAMLVLPRIFSEANYATTVTDPPFSNYAWSGDFRPFNSYPKIDAKHLHGLYTLRYKQNHSEDFAPSEDPQFTLKTRLPVFSMMKTMWPIVRELMYDSGNYLSSANIKGNFDEFLASYAQLYYLNEITSYNGTGNTYFFIDNEATHEPLALQYPDFNPSSYVEEVYNPFKGIKGIHERDVGTYHVNVASFRQIGKWLEQLRIDEMYDNTRIIIVADHGRDVYTPAFAEFSENSRTYGDYHPLLLFKDFNAEGALKTDHSFMTNADTPILALQGLPIDPVNPFTGNNIFAEINKEEVEVFKGPWAAKPNMGNIFDFDYNRSFGVKEDVFVESNWSSISEK